MYFLNHYIYSLLKSSIKISFTYISSSILLLSKIIMSGFKYIDDISNL